MKSRVPGGEKDGQTDTPRCLCVERELRGSLREPPLRRGRGRLAQGQLLATGETRGEIPGRHFHLRLRILAAGEITLLE